MSRAAGSTSSIAVVALFAAISAAPGCIYTVDDAKAASGDGAAGSTSTGGGGGSAGGGAQIEPGCPADGCPDASECSAVENQCEIAAPPACADRIVVVTDTRFHGSTCSGVETSVCTEAVTALVLEVDEGDWHVHVEDGGRAGAILGDCTHDIYACDADIDLEAGHMFGVWIPGTCGLVTFDVTKL